MASAELLLTKTETGIFYQHLNLGTPTRTGTIQGMTPAMIIIRMAPMPVPVSALTRIAEQVSAASRNRIAWVMHRPGDAARCAPDEVNTLYDKAWQVMSDLSPVALLDHWREPCLDWCREKRAVELLDDPVYPALGQVMAMRVSLSDHFVQFVSDGVRSGLLEA